MAKVNEFHYMTFISACTKLLDAAGVIGQKL